MLSTCISAFFGFLLYKQNYENQETIDTIFEIVDDALSNWNVVIESDDGSVEIFITIPNLDKNESTTMNEAISIMQSQYDSYLSKLSMLLTIFIAGITVFSIVIPLFNYIFFQKEHITRINNEISESTKHFDSQIARVERSVIQAQQSTLAMVDDNSIFNIIPVSENRCDKASAYYLQATIANSKQRHDVALQYIQLAVKFDPENACYRNGLSISLSALNEHDEAIVHTQIASNLDPSNSEYKRTGSIIYKNAGKLDDALLAINDAISLEPSNASNYCEKSSILFKQSKIEESLSIAIKAAELDKSNAMYNYNITGILCALYRYSEAISFAEKAVALDKGNIHYVTIWGVTLFHNDFLNDAIYIMTQVIEREKDHIIAYVIRGISRIKYSLFEGDGDYRELGFNDFTKALEIEHDNILIYQYRAEAYILCNNLEEAEKDLIYANNLESNDPDILHLFSVLWKKRKNKKKEKEYFDLALKNGYYRK
jgi:tetratricopeptide (TPR) repeat protein